MLESSNMIKIIGFIGQGWIGKNYADNYEAREYKVVRYSLDEEFIKNKSKIKDCDIVIIAVPTPTSIKGFDLSYVEDALKCTKMGQNIIIKSTLIPGTTEKLSRKFNDRYIFYSPEFLSERTAKYDVDRPHANILGIPEDSKEYKIRAQKIMETFPEAPFSLICKSREAEIIKYSRNIHGFFEVIFYNLFFDYVKSEGVDYEIIRKYIVSDPLHIARYANPIHASGHNLDYPARGAGGHCYIKDFKAFLDFFSKKVKDKKSIKILKALEEKNIQLLKNSKKDLDLLESVYGKKI